MGLGTHQIWKNPILLFCELPFSYTFGNFCQYFSYYDFGQIPSWFHIVCKNKLANLFFVHLYNVHIHRINCKHLYCCVGTHSRFVNDEVKSSRVLSDDMARKFELALLLLQSVCEWFFLPFFAKKIPCFFQRGAVKSSSSTSQTEKKNFFPIFLCCVYVCLSLKNIGLTSPTSNYQGYR